MTVAAPPPAAAAAKGVVSELKARLGPDSFALLQAVSIRYQRGEASPAEYYDLALDILGGDTTSLLRLASGGRGSFSAARHSPACLPWLGPVFRAAASQLPAHVPLWVTLI